MNKLKIVNLLFFAFALTIGLTSCEKWLDVKPKTEVSSDDLFETEAGFKSSLAGVYTGMTETTLYGKETTFGLIGVLGMEWSTTTGLLANTSSEYYNAKNYDYENTVVKTKISNIWSKSYNTIANANNLILYTEQNRSVLRPLYYNIIRGEAFAIRAFLHFDLLRMFAPHNFITTSTYIPYVESTEAEVSVLKSPSEVISKIISDLDTAENLLIVDPIYTKEDYSSQDNGYLANRQYHLNYWAVKALKARIFLYANMKDSALIEAEAVIQAQKGGQFPWVTSDDVSNTNDNLRDRTFSTELLFALNNIRMEDQIIDYFKETTTPLLSRLSVNSFDVNSLFTEQSDYRYFFETDNGVSDVPSKFWQMDESNGITPKRDRMPLIRITEAYYIAAECLAETNLPKAVSYLQTVQLNRGMTSTYIPNNATYETFQTQLLLEYQREFLGEGQLYFYHKRMGTVLIYGANADYVFPLPDSETDYRN